MASPAAIVSNIEEEHFSYAMQLVTASSLPMVLLSVFRLGVFEIIAEAGPGAQLSPSQIVAKQSTKNPDAVFMVDKMLQLLASHSVLICSITEEEAEEDDEKPGISRVYGLAPVAKYFLRNPELGGASLGPFLPWFRIKY